MKAIFGFLLFSAASCAFALADGDSAVQGRYFRLLNSAGVLSDLKFDINKQPVAVFANSSNLSPPYRCPPTKTLTLYREIPPPAGAPPGSKATKEIVADIAIPAEFHRAIVALVPAVAGSALKLEGRVFDDEPSLHPAGTLRLVNLSSMLAAVQLGGKTEMAPAGGSLIVPYEPVNNVARVMVAAKWGNGWTALMNQERLVEPITRIFSVVVDSPPSYTGGPPVSANLVFDYVITHKSGPRQ